MPWGPVNQADSIEDPTGVYPMAQWDAAFGQILAAAAGGMNGVSSGCAVTAQGSPNNTVAVASGTVVVNGVEAVVSSGNVTMTAAHATLARWDFVSANASGTKAYTAGTAAVTPECPDLPANSVVLATIYVDANDNVINSNQIMDLRITVPTPIAVGGWTTLEKSVTTTRTSTTTLAADPDLLFNLVANGEYRFRGRVYVATNPIYPTGTQPHFKYRFAGPAAPALVYITHGARNPSSFALEVLGLNAYSAADHTGMTNNFLIVCSAVEFEGVVHNGANSGDFVFQWAQVNSVAQNTSVLAGSYLEYSRVD